jgi:hypothetical protein
MSYIFNFVAEILLILTRDLRPADRTMNDSNRPSSDTIYQGTVSIPHDTGISEKFRGIGNRFNLRTIFVTNHTLRGTLMKTGPVRDAQETKQCEYNIPCDCGSRYISETIRPLEERIKEHKCNLTQGLLQKSKLAQYAYEERHMLERSEGLAD